MRLTLVTSMLTSFVCEERPSKIDSLRTISSPTLKVCSACGAVWISFICWCTLLLTWLLYPKSHKKYTTFFKKVKKGPGQCPRIEKMTLRRSIFVKKIVHSISAYDSPRTGAIQTPYLLTGLLLRVYSIVERGT